jgi:hypothetical protein
MKSFVKSYSTRRSYHWTGDYDITKIDVVSREGSNDSKELRVISNFLLFSVGSFDFHILIIFRIFQIDDCDLLAASYSAKHRIH